MAAAKRMIVGLTMMMMLLANWVANCGTNPYVMVRSTIEALRVREEDTSD